MNYLCVSRFMRKNLLSGGNQRELARAKNAKKANENKKGQGAGAKVSCKYCRWF